MKRTAFSDWPCSIARSVDLLGDWWTPLVLRDAYFGAKRFEHFQRSLGIGRNVLTQRLNRLVDEGLFERVPYQEHPPRDEYRLTDKGRDFMPVLMAMSAWGDRWLATEEGPPVTFHAQAVRPHHRGTRRVLALRRAHRVRQRARLPAAVSRVRIRSRRRWRRKRG